MSEQCDQCRGGGEGRIDPYEQDEWYYEEDEPEMTEEEWADYCAWVQQAKGNESTASDQSLTPPSPTVEDDHEL